VSVVPRSRAQFLSTPCPTLIDSQRFHCAARLALRSVLHRVRGGGQARLKLGLPGKAEADCSKALVLEPGHRKALVRRAAARRELAQFAGALTDAKAARALDPSDKELKRLVRAGGGGGGSHSLG
jgi:hypothetical protein